LNENHPQGINGVVADVAGWLEMLINACIGLQDDTVRERERMIERGKEIEISFIGNSDCVGIEETDNLSLFDKLWFLLLSCCDSPRLFISYIKVDMSRSENCL